MSPFFLLIYYVLPLLTGLGLILFKMSCFTGIKKLFIYRIIFHLCYSIQCLWILLIVDLGWTLLKT